MGETAEPTEAEIDTVVAEFGGGPRAAVRALLHDLAVLALNRSLSVSRGYVRGREPSMRKAGSVRSSEGRAGRAGE